LREIMPKIKTAKGAIAPKQSRFCFLLTIRAAMRGIDRLPLIWSVQIMRYATLLLAVIASTDAALGADQLSTPYPKRGVARPNLPPGLPRPHYNYRTTVVYGKAPPPVTVEPEPAPLISSFVWTTPLLPGSYTLPGYYGRPFDYYYQGSYYGGEYGNGYQTYFVREPYACGVTGYC
jgi:hypothetical protein